MHEDNKYISHNIMKYQENTNTVIGLDAASALNCLWGINFLDNQTRTFSFKLHNNSLGYNYTVCKFVRHKSPNCTFCRISENPEDERETPYHIFYSCRHVENIYSDFYRRILNNDDFVNFNRNSYFGYPDYNNSNKNYCLAVINLCFKNICGTVNL